MAFSGVFIAALVKELRQFLPGGRIYRIQQPEPDELCLVIKNKVNEENYTGRLIMSADASLPLLYLADIQKENPAQAPNFCMLLRKHIGNGRIADIYQPDNERIVVFLIEHLDELGDPCKKKLIVELMGKHSNIIFADENDNIIDSIKHISHQVSSIREVLPGRKYTFPPSKDKKKPFEVDINYFMNHIIEGSNTVCRAIYTSIIGISPDIANELAYRAGVDGDRPSASLSMPERERLYQEYEKLVSTMKNGEYEPCIAYTGYEPEEFAPIMLTSYGQVQEGLPCPNIRGVKRFTSPSEVLDEYYSKKSQMTRIRQRSADLRKIVSNAIERTAKKYDLQQSQMRDTEKRDKYKVYGELITAYGYGAKPGDKELVCENYYTGEEITIPLDPEKTAMECGKKYFEKYNKLKRTYEALLEQTMASHTELEYLLSIQNSLEIATSEADLKDIKAELIESGYIRGRQDKNGKKKNEKSKPLHYISSDGYHMYVGKNNYQNDELTFGFATGNDMWFHAKQMAGSHVIVKTEGKSELPDRTYEEAARLAAYYSSGKNNPKVDVDYTLKKNLKKPPKSNPGFVIYHTNYSMTIEPDIHGIQEQI